ncbi:MAG: DALR domain-containing protein [Cloacibacillus evryensis]
MDDDFNTAGAVGCIFKRWCGR